MSRDPIFYHAEGSIYGDEGQDAPGWYFWDETWAEYHGPFSSEPVARLALKDYVGMLG